jgi:hypothetical protein
MNEVSEARSEWETERSEVSVISNGEWSDP